MKLLKLLMLLIFKMLFSLLQEKPKSPRRPDNGEIKSLPIIRNHCTIYLRLPVHNITKKAKYARDQKFDEIVSFRISS